MNDSDAVGPTPASRDEPAETPDSGDVMDTLEALEETVDTSEERRLVRESMDALSAADRPATFGRVIVGFDRSDAAEAFLGSLVFGLPMLVEGGTLEVGTFLSAHPAYYLGTVATTIATVVGVLYVADIQDVRVRDPLFGVLPRRLVGVLAISTGLAAASMTAWGRVDWTDPAVALAQVTVCFAAMAIGGALGDILPGT